MIECKEMNEVVSNTSLLCWVSCLMYVLILLILRLLEIFLMAVIRSNR